MDNPPPALPEPVENHIQSFGGRGRKVERKGVWLGIRRGLRRRCPNCDRSQLFQGYLKVKPLCEKCGSDNRRFPSDDIPPYLTILLVGHLVIGPSLALNIIETGPVLAVVGLLAGSVLALTLLLLPYIKGGVIGAEWALGIVRPEFKSNSDL